MNYEHTTGVQASKVPIIRFCASEQNMIIDPKFIELAADVFERFFLKIVCRIVYFYGHFCTCNILGISMPRYAVPTKI